MTPSEVINKAVHFNIDNKIDSIQEKINALNNQILELKYLQTKTIKHIKPIKGRQNPCNKDLINIARLFYNKEKTKLPSVEAQASFLDKEEDQTPILDLLEKNMDLNNNIDKENLRKNIIIFISNNQGCRYYDVYKSFLSVKRTTVWYMVQELIHQSVLTIKTVNNAMRIYLY